MSNIAVLDTDAVRKMGKCLADGTSHLSHVLLYFDDSYMHDYVFNNEIKNSDLKVWRHVDSLRQQRLVQILTDNDILSLINTILPEQMSCSMYITYLRQAVGTLRLGHPLYGIYNVIFTSTYVTIAHLVTDLAACDSLITARNDAGEIKSLVLTQALNFTTYAAINLFLSNDKKARKLIVQSTNGTVEGLSPIATFIILRDAGYTKTDCLPYFQLYTPTEQLISKINNKNNVTKTYQQLFDDIFDPSVSVDVTKEGLINYY